MLSSLLTVVLLFTAVLAQTRPMLSETFTTNCNVTIADKMGKHMGAGMWEADQPGGKSVQNFKFGTNAYDVFTLVRYDMMKEYTMDNDTHCNTFTLSGTMPPVWGWIANATFVGKDMYQMKSVDVWRSGDMGYATLTIAVWSADTTTPVYLMRESRNERLTTYDFSDWSATAPAAADFAIPSVCMTTIEENFHAKRACISSATIMARAKVWVDNHVPYNQGATYQGYREDCSGYVSMCWDSAQPGHTTETMHEIAHSITKDDLMAGDCLLYAAEHVVLFGGWTNSGKTEYMGYEETKPGTGTIAEATPYPYFYSQSDFLPYRYNNICT